MDVVQAKLQYAFYRNDDTLDFLAMKCDNKPDKYFCAIAKLPEYGQFGALALQLLYMSPDTVECERAFSHMNMTKTKHSARISQENLQARLRIYMDDRENTRRFSISLCHTVTLMLYNFSILAPMMLSV